jgi:dUTP pyrophosphatase
MKYAKIGIKVLEHGQGIPLPRFMTPGSAGADVCSAEDIEIPAGGHCVVKTGLSFEIPEGYEIQVRSRSGLAAKHGVHVLNSPGTIDSDYKGELCVILASPEGSFSVKRGDRIAQLVISEVVQGDFYVTDSLSHSERGSGGFGSTGM